MSPLPADPVECPPSAGLSPRYKCDPFRFDESPSNPGLCCGLNRIPDPYSIPGPNPNPCIFHSQNLETSSSNGGA